MHSRFFNYSDKAPLQFKNDLEKVVSVYDNANGGINYNPDAIGLIILLLGVLAKVLTDLSNNTNDPNSDSYKAAVSILLIVIPTISSFLSIIKRICQKISYDAESEAQELITEGTKDGFFNTVPNFPYHDKKEDEELSLMENNAHLDNLHRDAAVERILRRKP